MNPFEPVGGPEVPIAPIDVPTPDIPAANFSTIGGQLAQGAQSSGWWTSLLAAVLDWIPAAVGKVVGSLLGLIEVVIAWLLSFIVKIFASAQGGTDQIAAQAVGAIFDVPVAPPSFSSVLDPKARAALAQQVACSIFSALGAGVCSSAGGTLQPSSDGPTKFLNTASHIAIEGWLSGWLAELGLFGQLETFTELKDIMAHVLGLGRVAHTVIGPALKILSTDPFLWLLNNAYRPHLQNDGIVAREILRGVGDAAALRQQLAWQGFTDAQIDAAVNLAQIHLSPADLEKLVQHSVLSEDDAKTKLAAAGYDTWTAAAALELTRVAEADALFLEIARTAIEGVAQRKIDPSALSSIISNFGLPQNTVQELQNLAALKLQLNVIRPSLGEGQQMVEQGIWSLDQFQNLLEYHGYAAQDAQDLELLLLGKIKTEADAAAAKAKAAAAKEAAAQAKAAAAAAKAQTAAKAAEAKGVSLAEFQALVKSGLRTINDYQAFLTSKGIAADNVQALVSEFNAQLQAAAAKAGATAAAAATVKEKNLSLGQLAGAAKSGIISVAEYQQRIVDAGVAPADAQILADLLNDEIETAATKARAAATKKAAAAVKGVNLAEQETAVKLGLESIDDYASFLKAKGYDDADVTLLVSELSAQVAALKAAAAAKGAKSALAGQKGLNLAQLEKSVRAGVKTIDDYKAALSAIGYDADAQASLVSLLQLQIEADQQTLAASGRASALLGQHGLSLTQLANAVTQGVIGMSVYTGALQRAGLADADVQAMKLALAAKLASKSKNTTAAASVAKQVASIGLSLQTVEKDFLAGKLTIDQVNGLLTSASVSNDDISAVDQLVGDQLETQQQLAALVADATARAKARGLNLGQETAAVKAGVKTIDDFQAFAASLGYDPADVATLAATLQVALTAKAAKTPATPAPAPVASATPPAAG